MKRIKFVFKVIILTLLMSLFTFTSKHTQTIKAAEPVNKKEVKAAWVSPYLGDLGSSPTEYTFKVYAEKVFEVFDYYGLNTMYFHVRTHNNAYYKSTINPKAAQMVNIDFNNFDPFAWIIEEAHKRGIEIHAWLNPYRRAENNHYSGQMPAANPQSNNRYFYGTTSTILDPGSEEVRNHIVATVDEIVRNYDVDGIHFDDYFYVNSTPIPNETGKQERRNNVDQMIWGVYNLLDKNYRNANKYVQFGISPTGIYKNGNGNVSYNSDGTPNQNTNLFGSSTTGQEHYEHGLYADTLKWAIQGWIDYLLPQTYWATDDPPARYYNVVSWWDKVFKNLNVNIYSGIGLYLAIDGKDRHGWQSDPYQMAEQFNILEGLDSFDGYSIFSFRNLLAAYNNTNSWLASQVNNVYANNAERRSIKILPELKSTQPVEVGSVSNFAYSNGYLSWQNITSAKLYYVYKAPSYGQLLYTDDQIIGVVGATGETINFEIDNYSSNDQYGIRALSVTNHLGPISGGISDNYTISYNLNGGQFEDLGYESHSEMVNDFFEEYYIFLVNSNKINSNSISLTDFMHGSGNTTGFDGMYDSINYFDELYELNNKEVSAGSTKFVNQPEHNKWASLLDIINDYVNAVNSSQSLWGSYYDGRSRVKAFFQKDVNAYSKPTPAVAEQLMNKIPEFMQTVEVPEEYSIYTPTIVLPEPVKTDATFLGWYNNSNFTGPKVTEIPIGSTGNKYLYAKWQEDITYVTVNFDLNGGGPQISSQTLVQGSIVTPPADPTKVGYNFLGWYLGTQKYNFNTFVNQDITLVAKWEEKVVEVVVSFDVNGGTPVINNQVLIQGEKATKPTDPTKEGFTFLGWYLNNNLYSFNNLVQTNINLVAKWEEQNNQTEYVTITYNLGYDNMFLDTQTIEKGSTTTKPDNPTRDGYDFLGWYLNESLFNFSTVVNEDIILIANWTENGEQNTYYNISFDLNYEGSISPKNQQILEGEKVIKPTDPIRDGYVFLGWLDNGNIFNFLTPINKDYTLIANWELVDTEDIILKALNNVSLRKKTENTKQGLRFTASLNQAYKNNEHGFYLVYGLTAITELNNAISSNNLVLNNKEVFRKKVKGLTSNDTFSIVITGIPEYGYNDIISVIPYVIDNNNNLVLANEIISRTVFETALLLANKGDLYLDILTNLTENYKQIITLENNIKIQNVTLFDLNPLGLKETFIKDWNNLFSSNLNDFDGLVLFNEATVGLDGLVNENTNIEESNLYKFFNNLEYKDKWGWLLTFIKSLNSNQFVEEQIYALLNIGEEKTLYKARHLIFSINNFFNQSDETGSYSSVDFTDLDLYENLDEFNNKIYLNITKTTIYPLNFEIMLPEINKDIELGYKFIYSDGENNYEPGDFYEANNVSLEIIKLLVEEIYSLTFYSDGIKQANLSSTYKKSDVKDLPIIEKQGFNFLGWSLNSDLSGSLFTQINIEDTGNKIFYAKWEKVVNNQEYKVIYDLGDYGYISELTKEDLFLDFVTDYKQVFGRAASVEELIDDFFGKSGLPATGEYSDITIIFSYDNNKWKWLENYILDLADDLDIAIAGHLRDGNASHWRGNLDSFWNQTKRVGWPESMDFTSNEMANGFWKYSIYNVYEQEFSSNNLLLDLNIVSSWNNQFILVGFKDLDGNIISELPEQLSKNYLLIAVWEER